MCVCVCVCLCNAAVDVLAASLTYNSNSTIFRSLGGQFNFTLTVSSPTSNAYNVLAAHDGNWKVAYMLDNNTHTNDSVMQAMFSAGQLLSANLSKSDWVQGLAVGATISVTINAKLNMANNVVCFSLDSYKSCSPGIIRLYEHLGLFYI